MLSKERVVDRARRKLGDKVTIPAVVEEIEHTILGEINYKVVPLNTWFDADEIEALGQTESEDCISADCIEEEAAKKSDEKLQLSGETSTISEETSINSNKNSKDNLSFSKSVKLINPCNSLLKPDSDERKEQKSKLDCIRRQAVVGIIDLMLDEDTAELIRGYIDDLPSVTPTERTGEWIEREDWNGDNYYDCSVCGESFVLIDGTPSMNLYHYCPNCGAKMGGDME